MVEVRLVNVNPASENIIVDWQKKTIIEFEGHAGIKKNDIDLVCASISTLIQTIVYSIIYNLKIDKVDLVQQKGLLNFSFESVDFNSDQRKNIELLFKTLMIGLQGILREYPEALKITVI